MDTVRIGIIGIGNMGSGHVKTITSGQVPGMTLAAVADINPDRLKWMEENYPDIPRFDDAAKMMDSGLLDAVIVATPHYLHPALVKEALSKGLHALSEKPAGVYTKAVRELIDYVHTQDKTYAIMFNQRTNCVYRKMKEIVDSGEMGKIRRTNWIITDWYRPQSYYDSGAWRATWGGEGGGVLLNQCPHNLDLWQWICGMPSKVTAFLHNGKWHDIEVEDDVTAYVEYPNGATGVFITSTGDAPGTNRLEITGTKGRLIVENNELVFDKLEMDEREWCVTCPEGFKKPGVTRVPVETDGQNLQHVAVLNAFADHIEHGGPLVADGREGINGLMLSNAIHLSGWTGETVSLPIDEEKFLQLLNERRATSRHKEDVDVVMDTSSSYGSKVSK